MKLPMVPPDLDDLLGRLLRAPDGARMVEKIIDGMQDPAPEGKYRHWDILRHLTPPEDLTSEEWWAGVKLARRSLYRELPLCDRRGNPFVYATVDESLGMLHEIDRQGGGSLKGSDQVTDPRTRDTYLIKALFEEAITSSQLEGAATTRAVATEMLRLGQEPRDHSERMIYNNFQAMRFIRSLRGQPLTPSMVFELHRIVTSGTMPDEESGRFRRPHEPIHIVDEVERVLHVPPEAEELPSRMDALCQFANERDSVPFMHPVVRAIMAYFWLAYDHPFLDGNGRTARALFYWSMAEQGYWITEFLSISRVIKQAHGKYLRAFLYTETDDNDATYFVLNQLRTTVKAIEALHEYLQRKAAELEETRVALDRSRVMRSLLNPRQVALLNHASKNPGHVYVIESHQRSHGVAYQTARTDLLTLAALGLLDKGKRGRALTFMAPPDLKRRIAAARRSR